HVTAIAVDNEGDIWFGTWGSGVSKYTLPILSLTSKIFLPYIVKLGVP
ncbi:MAG: two-component regulator propeller domain-containing protein, partial [Anaerolineae bacterium]